MIRKATAFVLLIVLGLYLPAAAMPLCVCLDQPALEKMDSCCGEVDSCCEDHQIDSRTCCDDPECCIILPGLPDGMEPKLMQAPAPISLPAPMMFLDAFVSLPCPAVLRAPILNSAPPLPPGAPIRIAIGVWRL